MMDEPSETRELKKMYFFSTQFLFPGFTTSFLVYLGVITSLFLMGIISVAVFLINRFNRPDRHSEINVENYQRTERIYAMEPQLLHDISVKWELYTEQQQQALLKELRRKYPNDYYCKKVLFEFIKDKLFTEKRLSPPGRP